MIPRSSWRCSPARGSALPHNVVFGGFSAQSVRSAWRARRKALVTVDGARRRARTRRSRRRSTPSWATPSRRCRRHARTDNDARWARAATSGTTSARGGDASARPSRWTPSTRSTSSTRRARRKAEGHPAHDRRLPDRRRRDAQRRVRPQARGGRLLVHGRRRLDHRALLHRLRPARRRRTTVMYEGAPDYPHKDNWWELVDATRSRSSTPRRRRSAPASSGAPSTRRSTTCRRCACSGRWASRSTRGVALVPQGRRRRALPDRGHVVADRDRPHHDHPAAGVATKPGSAAAVSRHRAEVVDERRRGCSHRGGGSPAAAVARDARTLYRDDERFVETYWAIRPRHLLRRRRRAQDEDGYFWIIGRIDDVINVSGHRFSTAEVESAIVSPRRWPRPRRGQPTRTRARRSSRS